MNLDPSYIIFGAGLLLAAIGWLSKVHYDLIQLRRDARTVETKTVELARIVETKNVETRHHYDEEVTRLRTDLATVRAESQAHVSALKDGLNKLELRIETGFTAIMEQMKQLFKDAERR